MRDLPTQLSQLAKGSVLLHLGRDAPISAPMIACAEAFCRPSLPNYRHWSSSAALKLRSQAVAGTASNGQLNKQQQQHNWRLQSQQQELQHFTNTTPRLVQALIRHSLAPHSRQTLLANVQSSRNYCLHTMLMKQALRAPPSAKCSAHIPAQVRHVSHTTTCWQGLYRDQQDSQQKDRISSNAGASSSARTTLAQTHSFQSATGSTSQSGEVEGNGPGNRPGLQTPRFQRGPAQQPRQHPPSGAPSALQSRISLGPIYSNPKRNPRAPVEPQSKRLKANREITAAEVRLVAADGQHQVLPLAAALQAAQEAKLDLVEVAGGANPPVCRLLNHSKANFEAKVKERQAEKKQNENRRAATIKEVQFGAHTAEHDMQVKVKKAKELLQKGHRVKCILKIRTMRGQSQRDGLKALPALKARMAEFAEVTAPPANERRSGNMLSFYLSPSNEQRES